MERVILTTGGTGGHIFPALAVGEELKRRKPDLHILFVGGMTGPEGRLAKAAGLEFLSLPVSGVLGRGLGAVFGAWRLATSTVRAALEIGRRDPAVVAGFGGYAGFPSVLAARLRGRPTMIHEQNSLPGLANRILGQLVDRVCLSFPDAHHFFPEDKTVLTGNPVREAIMTLRERTAPGGQISGERRVLVVGGSQGAKAINDAVVQDLDRLKARGVRLWHQTGKADYESVAAAYAGANMTDCKVEPFIDDMAEAYAWADLLLCRSGATTLAEITCAGKAAVLVPFPHATHNHQYYNARHLETSGAAVIYMQKYFAEQGASEIICELLDKPERLAAMGRAAFSLGRPEAAAAVADELFRLAEGH